MIDLQKRYARVEDGEIKEPFVLGLHIKNRGHEPLLYSEVLFDPVPAVTQFQNAVEVLTVVGRTVVASYKVVDKDGNQILSELHDSKRDPEAPFDPMAQVDILITEVDPVITARVLELVKKMAGEKLDAFAKTREYDSIVSLATYATSAIPKFREEGQRGVDVRDATFAATYGYLEEMMQGTAFVPKNMYEVESKLPALTWEDAPAP